MTTTPQNEDAGKVQASRRQASEHVGETETGPLVHRNMAQTDQEFKMSDRAYENLWKPMTAQNFRGTIQRLNLNAAAAGRMLGITPRHARNFVNDEYIVPPSIAIALRLMELHVPPDVLSQFHSKPVGRPPAPEKKEKQKKAA